MHAKKPVKAGMTLRGAIKVFIILDVKVYNDASIITCVSSQRPGPIGYRLPVTGTGSPARYQKVGLDNRSSQLR